MKVQFNNSLNSSTSYVSPREAVLIVVESFIFLVLNVASLVGNLLVCMALYRNPSLRTVTNNFILSMALADLIVAVFVMPVYTASSFANRWIAEGVGLTLVFCCHNVAGATSILTVMLVSINRYCRVVRPELYKKIYSKKSSLFMVSISWMVTILVIFIGHPSLGIKYEKNDINFLSPNIFFPNRIASIYYSVFVNLFVTAPSLILGFCYVKIYQTIRRHNMAAAPSSQEGNSSYGVEEARITRLLTVVVVGFYLCWFPFYVTTFFGVLKLKTDTKYRNFYRAFPVFASSVINPIVYGAMNQLFRSEFLKIVCCR